MSVLSRSALESSPLADLHTIASELGLDGFRRLRKADLIDRIVAHQGGDDDLATEVVDEAAAEPEARAKRRRGGRGRGRAEDTESDDADDDGASAEVDEAADVEEADADVEEADAEVVGDLVKVEDDDEADERPARRSRGGRGRNGRGGRDDDRGGRGDRGDRSDRGDRGDRGGDRETERVAEGVIELFANGSGFLRLTHPEPSDDDVYISAAQVRRCELVSGDRVAGPVRKPRRSERYPSLVRVDTINGKPADEVAEGTPFDDLACTWPSERLALDGGEDATLRAIEWLTPIGRGSRVTITGGPLAGKSEALRRIAGALSGRDELEVSVVLAGVRPEEAAEWAADGPVEPIASVHGGAAADPQAQAVERAVETAKRIAVRGGHAVLLVDSLDALAPATARRAIAAARSLVDGGSLTIIAASTLPVGGETTVVALDAALTGAGRFPALDLVRSGTLRPERLVGDEGAKAIAQARAEALDQRGT